MVAGAGLKMKESPGARLVRLKSAFESLVEVAQLRGSFSQELDSLKGRLGGALKTAMADADAIMESECSPGIKERTEKRLSFIADTLERINKLLDGEGVSGLAAIEANAKEVGFSANAIKADALAMEKPAVPHRPVVARPPEKPPASKPAEEMRPEAKPPSEAGPVLDEFKAFLQREFADLRTDFDKARVTELMKAVESLPQERLKQVCKTVESFIGEAKEEDKFMRARLAAKGVSELKELPENEFFASLDEFILAMKMAKTDPWLECEAVLKRLKSAHSGKA